jgi:hypothetical protein
MLSTLWVQIPRVELAEMGPSIDFALRRGRPADTHVEKEAHKHPKITKRKVRLKLGACRPILLVLLPGGNKWEFKSLSYHVLSLRPRTGHQNEIKFFSDLVRAW